MDVDFVKYEKYEWFRSTKLHNEARDPWAFTQRGTKIMSPWRLQIKKLCKDKCV